MEAYMLTIRTKTLRTFMRRSVQETLWPCKRCAAQGRSWSPRYSCSMLWFSQSPSGVLFLPGTGMCGCGGLCIWFHSDTGLKRTWITYMGLGIM